MLVKNYLTPEEKLELQQQALELRRMMTSRSFSG